MCDTVAEALRSEKRQTAIRPAQGGTSPHLIWRRDKVSMSETDSQ